MAIKYTAKQMIDYAKSLADLTSSNFVTWGDCFRMLNSSYQKVYQDMINNGDLTYLTEVRLLTRGTSIFELPKDFYQLATVTDTYGNEIPKLQLASSYYNWGYEIKNDTIKIQGRNISDIILKYYPAPKIITYKREILQSRVFNVGQPLSGFDGNILSSNGYTYNIVNGGTTGVFTNMPFSTAILGKFSILNYSTGQVYTLNGAAIDNLTKPMITSLGSFVENTFDNITGYGWANDDCSARFMLSNDKIYYNGVEIAPASYVDSRNGLVIYWNNKWALVSLKYIIYEDGVIETTDTPSPVALIKCDLDTGFGHLTYANGYYYPIGWTPNTVINFPNNVLFDIVAYDLAIQFKMKQNADYNGLKDAYDMKYQTYVRSLPQDNDNFVTIRNVNSRYKTIGAF